MARLRLAAVLFLFAHAPRELVEPYRPPQGWGTDVTAEDVTAWLQGFPAKEVASRWLAERIRKENIEQIEKALETLEGLGVDPSTADPARFMEGIGVDPTRPESMLMACLVYQDAYWSALEDGDSDRGTAQAVNAMYCWCQAQSPLLGRPSDDPTAELLRSLPVRRCKAPRCSKLVIGRSDKRFCSATCRVAFGRAKDFGKL